MKLVIVGFATLCGKTNVKDARAKWDRTTCSSSNPQVGELVILPRLFFSCRITTTATMQMRIEGFGDWGLGICRGPSVPMAKLLDGLSLCNWTARLRNRNFGSPSIRQYVTSSTACTLVFLPRATAKKIHQMQLLWFYDSLMLDA
jgi:hypothetical protein